MRKGLVFLWFCLWMTIMAAPAWAYSAMEANSIPIRLNIEGKLVQPEVPPVIQNNRTMVPIRVIAEGLGAKVDWNPATKQAIIMRENDRLILQVKSNQALVNGKKVTMDAPPVIVNDRMLLPLRFVGETLGCNVGWIQNAKTVVVNRKVTVWYNGLDETNGIKLFLLNHSLYLPVKETASLFGLSADKLLQEAQNPQNIDSNMYISLADVDRAFPGSLSYDQDRNRLQADFLGQFHGVSIEENTVKIQATPGSQAKVYSLQNPDRIVMDLPHTILSDQAKAMLDSGTGTAVILPVPQAPSDQTPAVGEVFDPTLQVPGTMDDPDLQPLVKEVRFSQYSQSPYTVRVVVELQKRAQYQVAVVADGIHLALSPDDEKKRFMVVIDAGHGGKDVGAKGVAGNYEKDFTLAMAKLVANELQQYPEFEVRLTRQTDVYYTLQERVQMANDWGADVFLSIHANSFPGNPKVRGTETYYYNSFSSDLAKVVHRHLVAATGFPDRKVKQEAFYVIKNTRMPAVLTEIGFLTNAEDNKKMTDPNFRKKVAKALAAAIREYYVTQKQ